MPLPSTYTLLFSRISGASGFHGKSILYHPTRYPGLLCVSILALQFLLVLTHPLPAQSQRRTRDLPATYLDIDSSVKVHFRRVDASLEGEHWEEAVDILQQISTRFGDQLIQVDTNHYVNVRTFCHLKISRLPPPFLKVYRSRVDPLAEEWFQQSMQQSSHQLLERILEEAFCSSWGDNALWLLGELCFEQGSPRKAENYWKQLKGLPSSDLDLKHGLVYPDTSFAPAALEARLILCLIATDRSQEALTRLNSFRSQFPHAKGFLAGTNGPLADTLSTLLKNTVKWLPEQTDSDWPTFAGNFQRNKLLPFPIEIGALSGKIKLNNPIVTGTQNGGFRRVRSTLSELPNKPLAWFPAISNEQLVLNNRGIIQSFDLSTCQELWASTLSEQETKRTPTSRRRRSTNRWARFPARPSSPSYTLTVHQGRIYTSNPPVVQPRNTNRFRTRQTVSSIECRDLREEGKLLWSISPPESDLIFAGSPVIHEDKLFVALRRNGPNSQILVACYDEPDRDLQWIRFVCQASDSGFRPHTRQTLLTYLSGHIYVNTNLGSVASINATNGTLDWVFTYDRSIVTKKGNFSSVTDDTRDPTPCLVEQDIVLAAPSDTSLLFALHAGTGTPVWKTDLLSDVEHLLGVVQNQLIVSGRRLYSININTGELSWHFPDSNDPSSRGYGRGIISNGLIYWPLREEIRVFHPQSGRQPLRLPLKIHGETGGHLMVADGFLVIVQSDEIVVFSHYGRLFERYQKDRDNSPSDPMRHYRLGRAAEATNQWELALSSYHQTLSLADDKTATESLPVATLARQRSFHLLTRKANEFSQSDQLQQAAEFYRRAADVVQEPQQKIHAFLKEADTRRQLQHYPEMFAIYQNILTTPRLSTVPIATDSNLAFPAHTIVSQKLTEVINQHGFDFYTPFEQLASELYGKAEHPKDMESVARQYPCSQTTLIILKHLLEQSSEQPTEFLRIAQKLLSVTTNPKQRLDLQKKLATTYRKAGFTSADLFAEIDGHNPVTPPSPFLSQDDSKQSPPITNDLLSDQKLPSELTLPFFRGWDKVLSPDTQVLLPQGIRPSYNPQWLYLSDHKNHSLSCVKTDSGETIWTTTVHTRIQEIAYGAHRLIVHTDKNLRAINNLDGSLIWIRHLQKPSQPNHSSPPVSSKNTLVPTFPLVLIDHRHAYCHHGSDLIAIDLFTGKTLWNYLGNGSEQFSSQTMNGLLIILDAKNNVALAIDSTSGTVAHRVPIPNPIIKHPPKWISESRIGTFTGQRTVELFDIRSKERLWRYQGDLSGRWPQLLGDGKPLLLAIFGGRQLVRIHSEKGEAIWEKTLTSWIGTNRYPIKDLVLIDQDYFYYNTNGTLKALQLSDGKELWQQFLGGSHGIWRIQQAGAHLITYPVELRESPRSRNSGMNNHPDWAVVVCDKKTGQRVQQWHFSGRQGVASLLMGPHRAVVMTPGHLWSFHHRSSSPVSLAPQ